MNTVVRAGILAIIAVLAGLIPGIAFAGPSNANASITHHAAVVGLSGEVNEYSFAELKRQFRDARARGADTIILDINTYGGQVTAAMDISRFLKAQTDLHTVAFVDDKAISAGSM